MATEKESSDVTAIDGAGACECLAGLFASDRCSNPEDLSEFEERRNLLWYSMIVMDNQRRRPRMVLTSICSPASR